MIASYRIPVSNSIVMEVNKPFFTTMLWVGELIRGYSAPGICSTAYVPAGSDTENVPSSFDENSVTTAPKRFRTLKFAAKGLSAHFPSGSSAGTTGQIGPIDTEPRMPEVAGYEDSAPEGGGVVGGVTYGGVFGPYPDASPGAVDGVRVGTLVEAPRSSGNTFDIVGALSAYQIPAATNMPTINPMTNFRISMSSV